MIKKEIKKLVRDGRERRKGNTLDRPYFKATIVIEPNGVITLYPIEGRDPMEQNIIMKHLMSEFDRMKAVGREEAWEELLEGLKKLKK